MLQAEAEEPSDLKKKSVTVLCAMFTALALTADSQHAIVAPPACGPSETKYDTYKGQQHPSMAAAETSALVYVITDLRYGGTTVGCQVVTRIGIDGRWVGANCGTSYFSVLVPAGQHHLCADEQPGRLSSSSPLPALNSFVAEAGKTYYFQLKVLYIPGVVRFDLDPVNADEGQLLVTSSPASSSKPKK